MFQILVTGRGWFQNHSTLINDIETMQQARNIAQQLVDHFSECGWRRVFVVMIDRDLKREQW